MKRLLSLAIIFMIAALFSFSFVAVAQEPAATPSPAGTTPRKEPAQPVPDKPDAKYKQIRVIKGGNLALIAERCGYTQAGWRPLYLVNRDRLPKIETVGDMWRVLVRHRQILNLPAGWSYQTLDTEYVEPFLPVPEEARGHEGTTSPETTRTGDTAAGAWSSWLLSVILAAIALLVLSAAFATIVVPWFRRRNPSRYPSRIPGGLSGDADTAARQLAIAYPGRRNSEKIFG